MAEKRPLKYRLPFKILSLVTAFTMAAFGAVIYTVIEAERANIIDERVRTSELITRPILHSIYSEMQSGRADLTRRLITVLKTIPGVVRVQVIRKNGYEEAFQDFKTLREVERRTGTMKAEWAEDHPDKTDVTAEGILDPGFTLAIKALNDNESDKRYYIEEADRNNFTYLSRIESRAGCAGCHGKEGGTRGYLMISTSLAEPYQALIESRRWWIIYGTTIILILSTLFFLLLKRLLSRRIETMVEVVHEWGDGALETRMRLEGQDELTLLARSFNIMADSIKTNQEVILSLYKDVREAKTEWEKTFDSMKDLVVITDGTGTIIRTNRELASRLDRDVRDFVGSPFAEILGAEAEQTLLSAVKRVAHEKGDVSMQVDAPASIGNIWLTSTPLTFSKNGEVERALHVLTDVTALKRLTRLEEEKRAVEETSRFKSNLIASVSHDLRTPLTSIMGYTDLIVNRQVDEETMAKWLKVIHRECERLNSFLNDLLDLSRIEMGALLLESAPVDFIALVKNMAEPIVEISEKHALELVVDDEAMETTVLGDKAKLENVIANLMDNAVKYSPDSGIIRVCIVSDGKYLTLSVIDEGIGIPTDELKNIFKPFHGAMMMRKRSIRSTGLGLSISQAVVELHGGRLWAESEGEDKGSTFYLKLPLELKKTEK